MTAQHYLCERCGEPAKIVHHKIWLTPKNIHEQSITLCWDNLEALQNVQRIQIELDGSAPFEYVVAKAGEKESRIVEVTLLENKKEFTIPAGTTAKIKYYKPDGKFVLNNATISGNVITVTYTEQMLAVSGTGRGEIVLYNGTAVLRSATYYTKITPTVYKENGLISDNEFLDMAESIIAMNKQTDTQ